MTIKKPKICIVDYGFGNIASIENALNYLKFDHSSIKIPNNLNNFSHLILPGVGSFEAGMSKLKKAGWDSKIKDFEHEGIFYIPIDHQGCSTSSDEESKKIKSIYDQILGSKYVTQHFLGENVSSKKSEHFWSKKCRSKIFVGRK